MKPILLILTSALLTGCVTTTAPDGTKTSRFDSATAGDLAKLGADVLKQALAIKAGRDGKQIAPLE